MAAMYRLAAQDRKVVRPGVVYAAAIAALVLLAAAGPAEARVGAAPASFTAAVPGLRSVDMVVMPAVDEAQFLREDEERAAKGLDGGWRFAAPIETSLSPSTDGTWTDLEDGGRIWRLQVVSTGARTVNFGMTTFRLPEGATLHLYPATGSGYYGPYTAADAAEGELWTPVISGDAAVIELYVPGKAAFEPELVITQVAHDYRGFDRERARLEKSGWCNNDVVCPEWDPWDDQINSEGVYTRNGTWMCSGQMINSHNAEPPPYFLTAYHCGITSSNASTVVIYWNFQSPTCGQQGGGSLAQHSNGTTFKARNSPSDFCLVQVNTTPPDEFNVYYTGWNAEEAHRPGNCIAIHHPNTDEKAISWNDDPLTVTSYLGTATPGDGSHWRIDNWEDGTTEGGSSGSGIWDADKRLVGQLHGGYASCSSITSDWYGRLSKSWLGGGTSSTRLSDWLDPQATGVLVLDGRYRQDPTSVTPVAATGSMLRNVQPNPARGAFSVSFDLPAAAQVGAEIFDAAGRLVRSLPVRQHPSGAGQIGVAPGDAPLGPGLYFVRLSVDGVEAGSRKLIVVE